MVLLTILPLYADLRTTRFAPLFCHGAQLGFPTILAQKKRAQCRVKSINLSANVH